MHIDIYISMHTHIFACIRTQIHIYACTHTHIYTHRKDGRSFPEKDSVSNQLMQN